MYYCNELLGLNVLSLYEGELLGKVDKLYFDKKLKKLIELELIGENDTCFILNSKNIYHTGKNAITVKNNQAVSLKVEDSIYTQAPLGSKAYSITGEFLGVIKDFTLNEKFLCEKFLLDNNQTLEIARLVSCGKYTVIFYDQNTTIKVSKFTPKHSPSIFKSKRQQTAKTLPVQPPEESAQEVSQPSQSEPVLPDNVVDIQAQKTVQQTAEFLIGRVCTKDIFNFNNEVLIKAHAIITKKNLQEISKFGKLRELMLYNK